MNKSISQERPSLPFGWQLILTKDFDVTWAGGVGLEGYFGLGADDGRFLTVSGIGSHSIQTGESPLPSGEAVSGAAFTEHFHALGSRSEVVIRSNVSAGGGTEGIVSVGSHDLVSTPSGRFVSASGRHGLLTVTSLGRQTHRVAFIQGVGEDFNFYKVAHIPMPGREIIACASRTKGLIGTDLTGPNRMFSIGNDALDIVDVCPLINGLGIPAVAAVSRDCSVIVTNNVMGPGRHETLSFPWIEGIAYRILSANGHICILTSKALYVMYGLANRWLSGSKLGGGAIWVRKISVEAVDANLVGNRWILIVMPSGVLQIDFDTLRQSEMDSYSEVVAYSDHAISQDLDWESSESYSEEIESAFALV